MKLSLELISRTVSQANIGELINFSSRDSKNIPILVTDTCLVSLTGITVSASDIFKWDVTGFKVFTDPGEFLKSIGWTAPKKS